jgi:hypothetical protein
MMLTLRMFFIVESFKSGIMHDGSDGGKEESAAEIRRTSFRLRALVPENSPD